MTFKELEIEHSYISKGKNNITESFINPVLRYTKIYKRSVGFFSSTVIETMLDGIMGLVSNDGRIQMIASPKLSNEDIDVIEKAYEDKKSVLSRIVTSKIGNELEQLSETRLQMLYELIVKGYLDIKIAITEDMGIYHDKLGVLIDNAGNRLVFYGSSNETYNGYKKNYEKIRVSKSWEYGFESIVNEEEAEFDSLWNDTNEFVNVYSFSEITKTQIERIIREGEINKTKKNDAVVLRDYQQKAINAWVENGYNGFYVMATGTGKTWTAIYSAVELLKEHNCMIVICAPYKHLVKQWAEDLEKVFCESKIIMVSSENPGWHKQISDEIISKRYNKNKQIVIISTIASFSLKRFYGAISKSDEDKLLIVDEAHRFTERPIELKEMFKYMLGLSATPFSGRTATKGIELMKFFGGQVFSLPIEEALDRKFLVPYNYYPIYVHANGDEENKFSYYTRQILSCFKNGVCVNPDLLVKYLRNRLRVISMAEEKNTKIDYILNKIKEKDHFVVYCGDGHLFDGTTGEELRHIQSIKRKLTEHEYKSSQFTAQENMSERMELVDAFNKGEISALAAIRCLDEGINIPSIKSALILSSNDDYREFVQRRGRILRTYKGKETANIYDVVVLPSYELSSWAVIELRRFKEFARLALNWEDLQEELQHMMDSYSLSDEDVDVYDYEDMEDYGDE